MPFGIGTFLKGALSSLGTKEVVGSIATSALSSRMQQREAEKNRNFQADMSNTAYQRAMADMRQAGLNPMLAFSQGGASTPGGSMANPQIKNPFIEANTAKQIASDTNLKNNQSKISDLEYEKAKMFFDNLKAMPKGIQGMATLNHFNINPKTFKEGLMQGFLTGYSGGNSNTSSVKATEEALRKSEWRRNNKRK